MDKQSRGVCLDGLGTAIAFILLILLLGRVYEVSYRTDTLPTYGEAQEVWYQPHQLNSFGDLFPVYFSAAR